MPPGFTSKKRRQWLVEQANKKALQAFHNWDLPIKEQFANAFGLTGGLDPINDEGDSSILYNIYKGKSGANLIGTVTTGSTWTIAAVNKKRVQQLTDLRTAVEAHFADYEFVPKYKRYSIRLQMVSTGNFAIMPFAAILENGESIAATDSNSDSITTAVSTAMPAAQNRSIIYGPLCISRFTTANAVDRYIANIHFDFTKWADSLAEHVRAKRMAEENPIEFKIGICAIGTASQVIYWSSHDTAIYYLGEPNAQYEMGDN